MTNESRFIMSKTEEGKQREENNSNVETVEFIPFTPNLDEQYIIYFDQLSSELINLIDEQRIDLLEYEIKRLKSLGDYESLKVLAAISILKDLLAQDWQLDKDCEQKLILAPPNLIEKSDKDFLRKQLQKKRNVQFSVPSIYEFVKRMEKQKKYKGEVLSVLNLIADPTQLSNKIRDINSANNEVEKLKRATDLVKPYLQLIDGSNCSYTGYKLMDIWRYFRYTWSIPYQSTPGRKLFYLVRDAAQPFHPIMGIAALGNCVLQLTQRDNYIGWTIDSLREMIMSDNIEATRSKYDSKVLIEDKDIIELLLSFLDNSIKEINHDDLISDEEIASPSANIIEMLKLIAEDLKNKQFNNKKSVGKIDWMKESKTSLYTKKRAVELAKLLEAKLIFKNVLESEKDASSALKELLKIGKGKAVVTALQANRKEKIGSNLMEIIVCGAIPPYNEILSGKLVSMLMCSPIVIKDYNMRYSNQVSEIASRMKGKEVIRDSRLAFLGTTSLYHMGSSQYNRIKIPVGDNKFLEYKRLGKTVGFGSVFFSQETTSIISAMVEAIEGGKRFNNVFGEGTSPRLRLIRAGLVSLGLSEKFLKHHTQRIVYGIELASNSREYLNGFTNEIDYLFPQDGEESVYTEQIIGFWRRRWLINRIQNKDICERVSRFTRESILLSSHFDELPLK